MLGALLGLQHVDRLRGAVPCWEEVGANDLLLRTHWSGMPLGPALAGMRLISDELVPALRRIEARG